MAEHLARGALTSVAPAEPDPAHPPNAAPSRAGTVPGRRALLTALLAAGVLLLAALPLAGNLRGAGGAAAAEPAVALQDRPVIVFAASSLTDAFREIGDALAVERGVTVRFNFAGSSQLRTQLEQGATADVFASADQIQLDRARSAGLIAGPDRAFAENRLVIVAPAANPAAVASPADLARPGLRLVTAGPEVPIGVYTQHVLDVLSQDLRYGADFKDQVNANVVSREPNVRQVLAKVQLGEADVAVVYRSDATATGDLLTLEVPEAASVVPAYPIALVKGGENPDGGQTFVEYVLSPAGQAILARWGFTPVRLAAGEPAGPVGPAEQARRGLVVAGASAAR